MNTQQINPSAPSGGKLSVINQFRGDLERMGPQFAHALPAHIPLERFNRVVMTAIQNKPDLLKCTRQSLFNACMRAAQDGLLPDGREGAIVPFGENEDGRKASDQAAWMPMVAGIRKKARNSGELTDLYAHVVHVGDEFDVQLGDDPHVHHKPSLNGSRTRQIVGAYSIAVFKDGTKSYEWMTIDEIEDTRKRYSRAKRGPWSDPIAYPEMCRKTVVRLHCKSLPMSTDLDTVLRRDEELYRFKEAGERGEEVKQRQPRSAMAALERWVGEREGDPADQEIGTADDPGDPRPGDGTTINQDIAVSTGEVDVDLPEPTVGELIGMAQRKPPKDPDTFKLLVSQLIAGAKAGGKQSAAMLVTWWTGPNARAMRNGAQMTGDDTAALTAEVNAVCNELGLHET
jgi:recombination protein RecT